eukprot:11086532-Alexandrium_andersonii.AAC.1
MRAAAPPAVYTPAPVDTPSTARHARLVYGAFGQDLRVMGDGGGVAPPHALASALTERLAQPVAAHEALGLDPASRTYIP